MAHGKTLILRVLGITPKTVVIPTEMARHVRESNRSGVVRRKSAPPPIDLPERIFRAWEHEEGEKIEMVI